VQNAGGGTISYTISDDAAWLSCTPNSGSSSGESDAITVSYNAAGLAMGVHGATITITDPGAINSPLSVPVQLTVGLPPPVTFYEKTMDSDPGWTLDSGWAFGQPTGGGGSTGNSDPTSGYTGNNVIGYNLSGDYENSINPTRWATTEAIDCSNYAGMTLQFQRWLGVEYDPWDKAYVQASVDGANWTTLWENPDSNLNGGSWELCEYDLPAFMDEQATVYIRWGMGNTDSTVVFCGWNIDDVKLIGSFVGDPGNNTAPVVDAGPNQSVVLVEGAGGGDPVAGAYFEWDAAADTGGDANWESTTANA
jgi:hypothetical protein